MPRQPAFALIDKNLCNYPLARDARASCRWRRRKDTHHWFTELPGEERIEYELPGDVDERLIRHPTAFDMNLLFLLLSEARRQKTEQVEFASRAALLRALGFGIDRANMRRLDEALELWSVLSIQFDCWYFAGRRLPSGQDVDRQQARGVLATGGCSTFTPRRVAHRAGHKKGSRGEKKRRLYKTGTRGEKKLAPPLGSTSDRHGAFECTSARTGARTGKASSRTNTTRNCRCRCHAQPPRRTWCCACPPRKCSSIQRTSTAGTPGRAQSGV